MSEKCIGFIVIYYVLLWKSLLEAVNMLKKFCVRPSIDNCIFIVLKKNEK